MACAFTTMANKVTSAFSSPSDHTTPTKDLNKPTPSGMSPGRKIDLQAKLFSQIDMIHGMFERGAITTEQFEKRRCSLLTI